MITEKRTVTARVKATKDSDVVEHKQEYEATVWALKDFQDTSNHKAILQDALYKCRIRQDDAVRKALAKEKGDYRYQGMSAMEKFAAAQGLTPAQLQKAIEAAKAA